MPMISKLAANKLLDEAGFGIPDVCAVCRKMGEMKKCGRGKQAYYCSAECQKADWPQHKAICAQTIEGRAREVAESGDPSFPSRFFKWQKLCCAELAKLAHGLLADHELKTHFVFIQADYVPDKKPYFRVWQARPFPLTKMLRPNPSLYADLCKEVEDANVEADEAARRLRIPRGRVAVSLINVQGHTSSVVMPLPWIPVRPGGAKLSYGEALHRLNDWLDH